MKETRYYLCDRVGTGFYGDEYRPKDIEKMNHLQPKIHLMVNKPVWMVEIHAEPAEHDALQVDAIKLIDDSVPADKAAITTWLEKAGMDTTWVQDAKTSITDIARVIYLEIRTRQRENALIHVPNIKWVQDDRLRLASELDVKKALVKEKK